MSFSTPPVLLAAETGSWSVLVFYVLLALLISFVCSVAEAVLLSVTRPFILSMKNDRPRASERLQALKDDIDRPLAAILTLNTIAHTAGATMAGTEAQSIFEGDNFLVLIFTAIFTLLLLIGSEIIPKTLGARYWKKLAPATASVVLLMIKILMPFIWLSQVVTRRLAPPSLHAASFTREEFRAMAELATAQGHLDEQESIMLRNLFLFRDAKVESIMTPSTVVFRLPASMKVGEYVSEHNESPFSRVPVHGEHQDDIKGFVLRVNLLQAHSKGESDRKLGDFVLPITVVPPKATLLSLFAKMNGKREHIALVVDEFGAMRGIVTLEDLVETLIGIEIVDEIDENVDMQKLARDLWQRRAKRVGLIQDRAAP